MKLTEDYAPIVLFVFARPNHTQETIDALLLNPEAKKSDLIVYSDAPRNESDKEEVNKVRNILANISGFKSIRITHREENYGLARNIMEGISEVFEKYDKVIILEDDIVTSPAFLNFINAGLNRYERDSKVWHISGWNFPIEYNVPHSAYFWRTMNCWGWATWRNRWQHFSRNPSQLIATWDKDCIEKFNLDGCQDFWSQVLANNKGSLNTWAVFWYATIFKNKGLCLNPTHSYVYNIGNDGSGENCGKFDPYRSKLNLNTSYEWPITLSEDENIVDLNKKFYLTLQPSLARRLYSKIKRTFL
ncbi:glycosyltransferase [Vibrio fluvialis]|nr:glycosyltransferase [Vibrio fluvialis]MBY7869536.1 glycosyltransferase [Vibrio fluvialis]